MVFFFGRVVIGSYFPTGGFGFEVLIVFELVFFSVALVSFLISTGGGIVKFCAAVVFELAFFVWLNCSK